MVNQGRFCCLPSAQHYMRARYGKSCVSSVKLPRSAMHTFCTVCTNLGGYMYVTVPPVQRYIWTEIGPTFVSATKNDCSVRSVPFRSVPGFSTTPSFLTEGLGTRLANCRLKRNYQLQNAPCRLVKGNYQVCKKP